MLLSKRAQEILGVKDGAGSVGSVASDIALENALNGFADQRRLECVDVLSSRRDATRLVASFDYCLDQESLCRAT